MSADDPMRSQAETAPPLGRDRATALGTTLGAFATAVARVGGEAELLPPSTARGLASAFAARRSPRPPHASRPLAGLNFGSPLAFPPASCCRRGGSRPPSRASSARAREERAPSRLATDPGPPESRHPSSELAPWSPDPKVRSDGALPGPPDGDAAAARPAPRDEERRFWMFVGPRDDADPPDPRRPPPHRPTR
jgi:hypothetical protein